MNILSNGAFSECTSCQVCSAICPNNSITIELSHDGFYRPLVDSSTCSDCGLCTKVCYKFDNSVNMSDSYETAFSSRANDATLLKTVTSGGIAHLLAEKAVQEGYKAVGIIYNTDLDIAEADICDGDVSVFKGSKYIQAYTESAFKKLLDKNTSDKYVVFGTPCQIYALNKAVTLRGRRDKFIFIDLFCHGCPSMLLWKKSVAKAKTKLNTEHFDRVEFRSKRRGWHEFCLLFEANGKTYVTKNEFDTFYKLFFDDVVLNDACADCKLRSTLSYTDIRLGDFWGKDYDTDRKGISAVVAATCAGEEFIHSLKDEILICNHSLDDIIRAQSYGKKYSVNKQLREGAFRLLKSDIDADKLLKEYIKLLSTKSKIKMLVKKTVYLLPPSLRIFIRKFAHILLKH